MSGRYTKPLLAAAVLGLSGSANAELKSSLGLDLDVSLNHNDHGFEKSDSNKNPAKTAEMASIAYLNFSAEKGMDSIHIYYPLFNIGSYSIPAAAGGGSINYTDGAEVFYWQHNFNEMLSFLAGKNYINVGGYDNKNWVYNTVMVGAYTANHLPISTRDVFQLGVNVGTGGTVTLQFFDDVVTSSDWAYFNKEKKQPAFSLEWTGTFGPVSPLLQIVKYDGIKHSTALALGLGVDIAGLTGYLTYNMDTRQMKQADDKSKDYKYSQLSVDLKYNAGIVAPFLIYQMFDMKQPDKDHKGNLAAGTPDDNETSFALGLDLMVTGDNFAPYLAYKSSSQKVLKDITDVSGSTETKTQNVVTIGISGKM